MKNNRPAIPSTLTPARPFSHRNALRWLALLASFTLPFAGGLRADAPPTTVHLAPNGTDIEGLRNFRLEWNAFPNAGYLLESTVSLAPGSPWHLLDAVKPASAFGSFQITVPAGDKSGFYRLGLPQPDISSVEPAVFSSDVAVDAWMIGQCFVSTDTVRVDGVAVSGAVFVNSGLLRFTLPPLSAGAHVVELVRGGAAVSSFTVTNTVGVASGALSLQGPPDAPPASPAREASAPSISEREASAPSVSEIVVTKHIGLSAIGGGVRAFSGEVSGEVCDLVIAGRGLEFIWARTYHSRIGRTGASVNGWTFSYDVNVQSVAGDIVVHDGTGRADTFKPDVNGTYTCPEFFREGTLAGNVFKLTFADTGYWQFNPLDASASAGKLSKIVDRNGNTISLNYDASGRLAQIVDDLGRTNTVGYNAAGQLASVTDFSGRTVTYQYYQGVAGDQGGAGDLKSATSPPVTGTPNGNDFPAGKTVSYTYSKGYANPAENHLLLSVIDATGQTACTHVYQHNQTDLEFLRCISTQHWTNTPTMLSYVTLAPTPANQFATVRCIVNDPVGDVTEALCDARGRCVRMEEFTGRATPGVPVTATVNRPVGRLRASDPASYVTRMSWNNDSLCTAESYPGGEQLRCIYESDFDKTTHARKRADCRVVREIASSPVDLDGDGASDVTERVSRYEYDPRFGSEKIKRFNVELYCEDIQRNRVGNTPSQFRESPTKRSMGFCTSATDPRGNVTTGEYDSQGNAKSYKRKNGAVILADFDYKYAVGGQLTAFTNAADANGYRRVDTFSYYGSGPSAGYLQACVVDAGGLALTESYECDARGNPTRCIDPRGNDWLYTYNALDQCVQSSSAALGSGAGSYRIRTQFAYDANDNLTLVGEENRDASGTPGTNAFWRTQFIYDGGQRMTACWRDKNGALVLRCNQVEYNAADQVVLYRSPEAVNGNDPLNTVAYQYDERGMLFREIGAPGSPVQSTSQCDYDANGNVNRVSEGLEGTPSITTMEYDGFAGFGGSSPQFSGRRRNPGGQVVGNSRGSSPQCSRAVKLSAGTSIHLNLRGSWSGKTLTPNATCSIRVRFSPSNASSSGYRLKVWQLMQGQSGSQAMRTNQPIVTKDVDNISQFRLKVWQLMQGQSGSQAMLNRPVGQPAAAGLGTHIQRAAVALPAFTRYMKHSKRSEAELNLNRVSKITDPMGNVTTCNYDANDNLKVVRHFGQTNDVPGQAGNTRLAESRFTYDGLDRETASQDGHFSIVGQTIGDGYRTTACAYAPNGEITSITDDLGRVTPCAYDTACRLSSVSSPGGKTVTAVFRDAAGNVTSSTQTDTPDLGGAPQVFAWTNGYDALNRCVSTADNVGNTTLCAYDSRDNCVLFTDPKGNETVNTYDGLSRWLTITDFQGAAATGLVVSSRREECDDNDRCTSSTDANGNVTQHTYDSLDRRVQTTQADGTHTSLVWNPRSNLTQETDANGTSINHTYDLNDRCIASHITPGAGVASTTLDETFAYDGSSRLVAANNDASSCTYTYDSLDNCVSETTNGLVTASTYNALGERLSLTYPGGRALTYTYDVLNRCTSIVETGASLASFTYAGPDRVGRVLYGNGTRTLVTYDGIAGTPNAVEDFGHGQIRSMTHAVVGSSNIAAVSLKWDRNGNKTLRTDTIFAPAIPRTNNLGLQYDGANRLTRATLIGDVTILRDTTYGLDLMGNRTNVTGALSCSGSYFMDGIAPGPLDFQMNQYTTTPCDSRTYDDNGNLARRALATGPVTYSYDYAGRLVQVQSVDFSGGAAVISTSTYAYDAMGRRVSKTVSSGSLPPATTEFAFDGNSVIEERSGGATTATYGRSFYIGSDEVFTKRISGQNYFFHADDQGNTLALTTTGGAVVERYDYDDYGAATFLTSDGTPMSLTVPPVGGPYFWHDQRLDAETGLQNNDGGGYFEPSTARHLLGLRGTALTNGGKFASAGAKAPAGYARTISAAGNNPWSGGTVTQVSVTMTNSVGTSTVVSGGR